MASGIRLSKLEDVMVVINDLDNLLKEYKKGE